MVTILLTVENMVVLADIPCIDAESCVSGSVIGSNEYIYCYGYNSCRNNRIILSSGSGGIECSGSYACYNAINMSSGTGPVSCNGLLSCANVDRLETYTHISCDGEQSCSNSMIVDTNSAGETLRCGGDRSCKDSTIYILDDMYVFGHLAAENAVFISNDASVSIYFFSHATNGPTFICQEDHDCTIYCGDRACNNLTTVCNNCSSINVVCSFGAQKSDLCKDGMFFLCCFFSVFFCFVFGLSSFFCFFFWIDAILFCELSKKNIVF